MAEERDMKFCDGTVSYCMASSHANLLTLARLPRSVELGLRSQTHAPHASRGLTTQASGQDWSCTMSR